MFQNLPPVCRGLILTIVVSAALSLAFSGVLAGVLPLYGPAVTRGLQVWRLVSYPFFVIASLHALLSSILSVAWIVMLIAFFGGELETIVHARQFAIGLGATILIGGLLFLLIGGSGTLAGPSIITMFILAGFSYLWPTREISIFGIFWVKAWIITLVIFVLSIIPMSGLTMDTSATNLFGPFMGAIGALVYFHVVYRQYNFGRAVIDRVETMRPGGPKPKLDASDPRAIELQIDALLDKISANGMESLSKDERAFLVKHSGE